MTGANSEVPFEFGQDIVADVVADSGEQAECVFPRSGASVVEGYVAGEVELHFHFRLIEPELADYCIVFENAANGDDGFADHAEIRDEGATRPPLAPALGHAAVRTADHAQALVPIYAGKLVEDVKFVAPSLVRLQLLDSCPHRNAGDFGDLVRPATGAEGTGPFVGVPEVALDAVDGEARGGAIGFAPFVLPGQTPSEVFQTRTHILKGVPDDRAQERRRLLENLHLEDVLAAVRVDLVGDSVRISGVEGGKFVAQNFQVLVRPKQLEADTRE